MGEREERFWSDGLDVVVEPKRYIVPEHGPSYPPFTLAEFLAANEDAPPAEEDVASVAALGLGGEATLFGGTGAPTTIRRVS